MMNFHNYFQRTIDENKCTFSRIGNKLCLFNLYHPDKYIDLVEEYQDNFFRRGCNTSYLEFSAVLNNKKTLHMQLLEEFESLGSMSLKQVEKFKNDAAYLIQYKMPPSISDHLHPYFQVIISKDKKRCIVSFAGAPYSTIRKYVTSIFSFILSILPNYHLIHGPSFRWKNKGYIITGPNGSGKTTLLLHILRSGGQFMTDSVSFIYRNRLQPILFSSDASLQLSEYTYSEFCQSQNGQSRMDWRDKKKEISLSVLGVDSREGKKLNSQKVKFGGVLISRLENRNEVRKLSWLKKFPILYSYRNEFIRKEALVFHSFLNTQFYYRMKTFVYWFFQTVRMRCILVTVDKNAGDFDIHNVLNKLDG